MWIIRGYERDGDQPAVEVALGDAEPTVLRSIWGRPDDDPLYDCYRVTPKIAQELTDRLQLKLGDSRLEYFLEFDE